jgi:hypothetical protein
MTLDVIVSNFSTVSVAKDASLQNVWRAVDRMLANEVHVRN